MKDTDFKTAKFSEALSDVLDNVYFSLMRKNASYGASVFKPPVLCPSLPPKVAILTRFSDKINRLYSGGKLEGESFDDTLWDLIGYGVLYFVADNMIEKKEETETADQPIGGEEKEDES